MKKKLVLPGLLMAMYIACSVETQNLALAEPLMESTESLLIAGAGRTGFETQSAAQTGAKTSAGTAKAASQSQSSVDFQTSAPGVGTSAGLLAPPSTLDSSLSGTGTGVPLRGIIAEPLPAFSETLQGGSVESFFQCAPVKSLQKVKNGAGNFAEPAKTTEDYSIKSGKKTGAGRFIWHVLDNIGMPMSTAKRDGMDPSISNSSGPFQLTDSKPRSVPPPDSAKIQSPNSPQTIFQRIPQSELEGTDSSVRDDAEGSNP